MRGTSQLRRFSAIAVRSCTSNAPTTTVSGDASPLAAMKTYGSMLSRARSCPCADSGRQSTGRRAAIRSQCPAFMKAARPRFRRSLAAQLIPKCSPIGILALTGALRIFARYGFARPASWLGNKRQARHSTRSPKKPGRFTERKSPKPEPTEHPRDRSCGASLPHDAPPTRAHQAFASEHVTIVLRLRYAC